ncbi:hypothetical protein B484DRAFT_397217, partial [Ochromonadaceae sp. CCMP2298]
MGDYEDEGVPRLHPDVGKLRRWVADSGGLVRARVVQQKEGWSLAALGGVDDDGVEEEEMGLDEGGGVNGGGRAVGGVGGAGVRVRAGDVLLRIPLELCLYADPSLMRTPLLPACAELMASLHPSQWRARLALALLSERVKPASFFNPYLRNLPFEFWGMPVFFSATEFKLVQDAAMMQRTRDRCRFLGEFTSTVLAPLQRSDQDPFSGNRADVNAFGWGFASASSRALRSTRTVGVDAGVDTGAGGDVGAGAGAAGTGAAGTGAAGTGAAGTGAAGGVGTGPVIVPVIDLASHSFSPTCHVRQSPSAFELVALHDLPAGAQLTIDYGLSNDLLLADFGFTADHNPHDVAVLPVDAAAINSARAVMGQSRYSAAGTGTSNGTHYVAGASAPTPIVGGQGQGGVSIGRSADVLHAQWLHGWQEVWLSCLELPPSPVPAAPPSSVSSAASPAHLTASVPVAEFTFTAPASVRRGGGGGAGAGMGVGVDVDAGVSAGVGSGIPKFPVDGKLLALLRIMYAQSEGELTLHGYDPFLLQTPGAILSLPKEAHV